MSLLLHSRAWIMPLTFLLVGLSISQKSKAQDDTLFSILHIFEEKFESIEGEDDHFIRKWDLGIWFEIDGKAEYDHFLESAVMQSGEFQSFKLELESPYDPCGDMSYGVMRFAEGNPNPTVDKIEMGLHSSESRLWPMRLKIESEAYDQAEAIHDLLHNITWHLASSRGDDERPPLLMSINEVVRHKESVSGWSLMEFLEYTSHTHHIDNETYDELTFHRDEGQMLQGHVSRLHYYPVEGDIAADSKPSYRWKIEHNMLFIEVEGDWIEVDFNWVPEGQTEMYGQPTDPDFPQLHFNFMGRTFLSELITSC